MSQVIEFESLGTGDLIVDAIYEGTSQLASDPISRLLPGCGNMGGFRLAGKGQDKQFVALFTTGEERDWPDSTGPAPGFVKGEREPTRPMDLGACGTSEPAIDVGITNLKKDLSICQNKSQ